MGLAEATKLLANGGILIVVSFHSLEDKIVKNFFNLYSNIKKNPSRYLPLTEKKLGFFRVFSKKPIIPDEIELEKKYKITFCKTKIRNKK